jgi:hypothetical protein
VIDLSFPHRWQAEILAARPLILPPRHFVYPREAEEVERGALEVLIKPKDGGAPAPGSPVTGLRPWGGGPGSPGTGLRLSGGGLDSETWVQPFLATCALGFRDPAVPTGIWSTPNPLEICAASGGYAYIIDTTAPERFTMIPYRPVLEVRPVVSDGLLLFVGHHSILAWAANGQAWQSGKLSDEGLTITSIADGILRGLGWEMMSDKETPFALDLRIGERLHCNS